MENFEYQTLSEAQSVQSISGGQMEEMFVVDKLCQTYNEVWSDLQILCLYYVSYPMYNGILVEIHQPPINPTHSEEALHIDQAGRKKYSET